MLSGIRPTARSWRISGLALMAGLIVAACSGSAAVTPTAAGATPMATVAAATAPPTATPTAAPTKGPATQNLVLGGPAGEAGPVTKAGIRCNMPSTSGTLINLLGQATNPAFGVNIDVQAGSVIVRYASGSGKTYAERDFSGTGVTNFDAGMGATIDSALTETPTTDSHGNLGVLNHISGTIDCGNQLPGSSTLSISGSIAGGQVAGPLTSVNVECGTSAANGQTVSIFGLGTVGSAPALFIMLAWRGSFTFATPGFYGNAAAGASTFTANGAHLDGVVVPQVAAGSTASPPPYSVHVTGDVICGTSVSS